jgi:acyl-CoA thioesterase FadM
MTTEICVPSFAIGNAPVDGYQQDKTPRIVHHTVQAIAGEPWGRLELVVAMFDLAARRTAPIPPEMRAKAEALRIG